MTRLLVVGASQGIGRAVCEAAVARGFAVRGMSRSGLLPAPLAGHCEAVKGDACDAADVARALEGVDVVVQALGVPTSLGLLTEPVTLFSTATRVLLPLMQSAGVRKLVCVTGFGAGDSRDSISLLQRFPFELVLKRAYDDKSLQESMIEASDLDWLIVRPGILVNCATTASYRVLTQPQEWRNGFVARADVADFIVNRIAANRFAREKPVIIRVPV